MVELLKNFLRAIDAEEESVRKMLAADRIGLMLRAALSELDYYYYRLKSQGGEATEEQEWQFYILMLGATRLVRLALESREKFDAPTLTFQRTEQTANAALVPIAHLGFIEHGRRVSDAVWGGLGLVEQVGDECLDGLGQRPLG
jgi:hypothetical protein